MQQLVYRKYSTPMKELSLYIHQMNVQHINHCSLRSEKQGQQPLIFIIRHVLDMKEQHSHYLCLLLVHLNSQRWNPSVNVKAAGQIKANTVVFCSSL